MRTQSVRERKKERKRYLRIQEMDEMDAWIQMNGWLFQKHVWVDRFVKRMYVWIYAQSIRGCSVRHVHNSVYTNESLTVQYHPNIFIFHVKTTSILFISSFQLLLFVLIKFAYAKYAPQRRISISRAVGRNETLVLSPLLS